MACTVMLGVLHLPFAKALLGSAGCPMAARMTGEQLERARHLAMAASLDGVEQDAPSRPALGFELDRTTIAEVHDWSGRHRIECKDAREGFVACSDVPAEYLGRPVGEGRVDELNFAFDGRGRLVNMTTLRIHLSADSASHTGRYIAAGLSGKLGAPQRSSGEFAPERLARAGVGSMASRGFRFRDYIADVQAMNVPSVGPSVREHYMSARD